MKRALIIIFSLSYRLSLAQDYPEREIDFSVLADELIGFQDADGNYDDVYENLVQLLSSPIDLNETSAEELRSIPFLSEKQIQDLIIHRNEYGNLISIYELQVVAGFDLETIYKVLPFVRVKDPSEKLDRSLIRKILHNKNNYFITRYTQTLEKKTGFTTSNPEQKFKGENGNWYVRFRNNIPGDFSLGFTADQDAGEKFRWNASESQFGFDHLSYHVQIMNKGRIKNLIVGDYQSQFGQGLILGGAFGTGKGAETISTVRKNTFGFVPYTSVNEAGYLRGVASTFEIHRNVHLSAFYSAARRDASVKEGSDSVLSSISSFQYTGLHRNQSEISRRKAVTENNYGAVLNVRKNSLDAGIIFNTVQFSEPVVRTRSFYNQFSFSGDQNTNVGVYINYSFYNINVFSEASRSLAGGKGAVGGVLASLPKIDFAFSFRRFDKNYYTFYSNAFAESSAVQNETGMYWGWKYQWKKRVSASGYMDLFKFPAPGFRRYAPSSIGHEWLVRLNFTPTRKIGMFAQMREESKERNSSEENLTYRTSIGVKRNYTINFDYSVHANIRLKTRVQFSTFSFEGRSSAGSILLQDIHITLNKFKLTARYALFDTDNFDNRQYVYENDVWLAYSMPVYEGIGVRSFVVVQYKLTKTLSFWIRYARTQYTDRNEIGSGLDMINGNEKNDIKLQARIVL